MNNDINQANGGATATTVPFAAETQSAFQNQESTSYMDTGNGLSTGGDSIFGHDVPEAGIQSDVPAIDTVPFTEASSAYVTPCTPQGVGQIIPTQTDVAYINDTSDLMKMFNRTQAKPVKVTRGTNVVMPLGLNKFIRDLGDTAITALNSAATNTAANNALKLLPNIKTPGSLAEVANVKRLQELKNVVINYWNRSVPFTDLSLGDRICIEACYMSDIGNVILPILGKYRALSIVKRWQELGYQYDPALLVNLSDQSVETLLKSIYSAVASLPIVDESFMNQISKFSQVYTTSNREGFAGAIMEQDLLIGRPAKYQLDAISAGSGYTISTVVKGITPHTISSLSLTHWTEIFLRADLHSTSEILEMLSEITGWAQSIRNNYQILLAIAQQLAAKGSIKYTTTADYLPVDGVNDYTLVYSTPQCVFNYAMKERFEYAPRGCAIEDSEGTANAVRFNLCDFMSANLSYIGNNINFRRPVGLHKGSKAWNTQEIAEIGVFKLSGFVGIRVFNTQSFLCDVNGYTIDSSVNGITDAYEDAYTGCVYHTANISYLPAEEEDKVLLTFRPGEIVSYYGYEGAMVAPYASINSMALLMDLNDPLAIVDGGSQLWFTDVYDLSDASTFGWLLANQINAVLTQLDLTFYLGGTKNAVGRTCQPLVLFNGYRGAFFDEFDISPISNAMAQSYQRLAISLSSKSIVKDKS